VAEANPLRGAIMDSRHVMPRLCANDLPDLLAVHNQVQRHGLVRPRPVVGPAADLYLAEALYVATHRG
jgi:hypothetical protein